jgi:starch synthase
MAPFAKVGGLADVVGSLPKALAARGMDVRVAMPKYKKIQGATYVSDFPVELAGRIETAIIRSISVKAGGESSAEFPVYMVDSYRYFHRDYIYSGDDDVERFVFFSKAVLEMLPVIGFKPDVIHCNDWQTGVLPFMLKTKYANDDFYRDIASLFTIHNLQYQGVFPRDALGLFGAGPENFHPDDLEFYGGVNFMKAGLLYADKLNTVSKTYAKEIQTSEYGERLEGILRKRSQDLYGILNGIDYEEFDPARDPRIVKPYSLETLLDKVSNKRALQKEMGLPVAGVPLIGLVSRLVNQKGLDLIGAIIDDLMERDLQLVVLGTGDPYYHKLFTDLAAKYPEKAGVKIGFDVGLAQRIYAGSDMFLMPSKFEPCGLGQIISLRYGTIPIVRRTGGLMDTIDDFDPAKNVGNGFSFGAYSPLELLDAIDRALVVYGKPAKWDKIRANAMQSDFSWSRSADEYVNVYKKAMKKRLADVA